MDAIGPGFYADQTLELVSQLSHDDQANGGHGKVVSTLSSQTDVAWALHCKRTAIADRHGVVTIPLSAWQASDKFFHSPGIRTRQD